MSTLLQISNAEKRFGDRVLFDQAGFAVNMGERIGVIGPNGAGKTTLFRVLIEQEDLDDGIITKARNLRVGYLSQEVENITTETVLEYLVKQGGISSWEAKKFAQDQSLDIGLLDQPVSELSGGFRMRLRLMSVLAKEPNLLLLDEPTNHLDLQTIIFLEKLLADYKGAYLVVSHDREFLSRMANSIVEVEAGKIFKFNGKLPAYLEFKDERRRHIENQIKNQEQKKKAIVDYANRFRAKARRASQVQSRLKELDKMEDLVVDALPVQARIRLPEPLGVGKQVIKIKEGELGYTDKPVLKDLTMILERGMKLAVVGENGAGKTTLLKGIMGDLKWTAGDCLLHPEVKLAYYAQHVTETLEDKESIFDAIQRKADESFTPAAIRNLAGALLFSGDDINKKVKVLSGGEKARVTLAQVLAQRASCLLLDEPTNHLDFQTVEILTEALKKYPGTMVFVSHERDFVRHVATHVLEVRKGSVEFFPGTYDEYIWSLEKGVLSERQFATREDGNQQTSEQIVELEKPKINYKQRRKELEKLVRKSTKDMQSAESQMQEYKKKIEAGTQDLMSVSGEEAAKLSKQLNDWQQAFEELENNWLMSLEAKEASEQELEQLVQS
jgi:ATP-binding cassette subfamily F protein 3